MFHGLTSSNLFLLCTAVAAVAAWRCVFSVPLGMSRGGLWVSDDVMSRGGLWVSDGVVEHHSQQRVAVIYLPLVQTSLFTDFLQFQILEYTKLNVQDKINISHLDHTDHWLIAIISFRLRLQLPDWVFSLTTLTANTYQIEFFLVYLSPPQLLPVVVLDAGLLCLVTELLTLLVSGGK